MSANTNLVPGSIQSRRALYYPYIHPRDVEWVKGTLLAFGQINRVVPEGFPLKDLPEIAFLRDEVRLGEALLVGHARLSSLSLALPLVHTTSASCSR